MGGRGRLSWSVRPLIPLFPSSRWCPLPPPSLPPHTSAVALPAWLGRAMDGPPAAASDFAGSTMPVGLPPRPPAPPPAPATMVGRVIRGIVDGVRALTVTYLLISAGVVINLVQLLVAGAGGLLAKQTARDINVWYVFLWRQVEEWGGCMLCCGEMVRQFLRDWYDGYASWREHVRRRGRQACEPNQLSRRQRERGGGRQQGGGCRCLGRVRRRFRPSVSLTRFSTRCGAAAAPSPGNPCGPCALRLCMPTA